MNRPTVLSSLLLAGLEISGAISLPADRPTSLKAAAEGKFYMGAALNEAQIMGRDQKGDAILKKEFNSITPENCLKWESVHPQLQRYDFTHPDRYVELGIKNHMYIIGHTLMWQNQTPAWVFQNADGSPVSKDTLLRRLREHILTVVGRYRGRIKGWDVVNEAMDDDGKLRTNTPWYAILGEEGIFAAYAAAHEADPMAELHYNEYGLVNPAKRDGVLRLVKAIRAHGLRLDAVGLQEHYLIDDPSPEKIEAEINAFKEAGFPVMITELDVSLLPRPEKYFGADIKKTFERTVALDPYPTGLPSEKQDLLTKRYADIFAVFVRHTDSIKRVTFWGISDADTWLNEWPIKHRSDYPLLFDRNYQPKPAYSAVLKVLASKSEK